MSFAAAAAPAAGSVTLGQLNPTPAGVTTSYEFAQQSVGSGNSYVVPGNGTITAWSTNASSTMTQSLTFKVYRKVNEPNFYEVVAVDGPRPLNPALLNPFTGVSIPVKAGDLIGGRPQGASFVFTGTPSDVILANTLVNNPGVGQQFSFNQAPNNLLNLTAVFAPSNTVTVNKTQLNKKKGTATLNLTLPNPGDLTASGKGVKASSAGGAVISKAVGAGAAKLVIKAKGKQGKTLNATGKVTLKVSIKYTPSNGDPGTKSVKVKLKKNG